MNLKELISEINIIEIYNKNKLCDIDITGISYDSRKVKPGNIFVAFKGENFDGHKYIQQSLQKGAVSVVCDNPDFCKDLSKPVIYVKDSRKTLAHLAAKFYDYPSQKLILIGVTGTDGKTTTCEIIYRMLRQSGKKAAIISTFGARIGSEVIKTGLHTTTPNSVDVQKLLAKMVEFNTDIAILETSSHGLAQYRVEACHFDIGIVTNLTSDHLDYHKTLKQYKKAKAKLLKYIENRNNNSRKPKTIILNKNDKHFDFFNQYKADNNLSFGFKTGADYRPVDTNISERGVEFVLEAENKTQNITSPLMGKHNVENILAAIAACRVLHIDWDKIVSTLKSIPTVMGRLDKIEHKIGNFNVFIDFAHTPQGLESVLKTVKNFTKNNIHVIFGCPGLRDRTKREPMGRIAAKHADKVYITADDPREEVLVKIMHEIARGCIREGKKDGIDYFMIPNRKNAIRKAINSAEEGDTVIACGKAHEKSLAISGKEISWDEYKVVREALNIKN
ncbi:MAG: UDP-N-acetylmuramoyl-L-alanyl-D-glutamate--2,6-diaminopimelate ligase [Candidatus Cloacimonetes bacterium]|nr:UDP-N-acetylmuramoyl-L-alanyl-D-glutamate--2,6-diaminopimelate ligase [Candidatus Cloacimonadota bacterium]